MLSLVIKDPKDIKKKKSIQNTRKKFARKVTRLKEITLQGEFRDDDGIIRKKEADQLTKWTPINTNVKAQEETFFQGANRKREVDTEIHGMYE